MQNMAWWTEGKIVMNIDMRSKRNALKCTTMGRCAQLGVEENGVTKPVSDVQCEIDCENGNYALFLMEGVNASPNE